MIGSSRPYCARRLTRTSAGTLGLVASSSKGSPGARARMVNRTRLIPIRTGTVSRRRRKKYLDMSLGRRPGPGPGQSLTLPLAVPVGEVPEVGVPARDVGALELAGHGGDHAAPQHGNDHHVLDDHVVHPDEEGSALDRIQLRLPGAPELVIFLAAPAGDVAALPLVLLARRLPGGELLHEGLGVGGPH